MFKFFKPVNKYKENNCKVSYFSEVEISAKHEKYFSTFDWKKIRCKFNIYRIK